MPSGPGPGNALEREHQEVRRRLKQLVDAIADGVNALSLKDEIDRLEARRIEIEARLAEPGPEALSLHPNAAEIYRREIEPAGARAASRVGG